MAMADFVDPDALARKQAARRAANGLNAPPQTPTPAYGNQTIADKVAEIGQRSAATQARANPSIAGGMPAGEPISPAEMAANAPDSAFARKTPFFPADKPSTFSPSDTARMNYRVGAAMGTNPAPQPAGPSTFSPAPEPAAPAAPAGPTIANAAADAGATQGILRRAAGAVKHGAGAVGKVLGYGTAASEGLTGGYNIAHGNYAEGAQDVGMGALDAAATRFPTPITVGSSIIAHGTDYLLNDTDTGRKLTANIAAMFPGSGASRADQSVADLQAEMADRQRRGLPIPASYQQALDKMKAGAADIRAGTPIQTGPTLSDLITGGHGGASPAPARPGNVNFVDPNAPPSGAVAPPSAKGQLTGADVAMNSSAPGTAVINGRVLSQQEIKDAGNRLSIVPSSAFTNPSVGDLYGATHGGATPTQDQAIAFRQAQTSGGGGKMFGDPAALERSQLLDNAVAAQKQRANEMRRLTQASEAELASGHKRAAGILANLAGNYGGDRENPSAFLPEQARPSNPSEAAVQAAQAANYSAAAQDTTAEAATKKTIASITDAISSETDPKKLDLLGRRLAAMSGKAGEAKGVVVKVPSQDVDANGSPINYEVLVNPADGTVIYDPRGQLTGKKMPADKGQ